jgi:hypothetical protein
MMTQGNEETADDFADISNRISAEWDSYEECPQREDWVIQNLIGA